MVERLRIRHKVLAVLLVPLLALTIVTLVQVGGDIAAGRQAARVDGLAAFAGRVTALVDGLQSERDRSMSYIAGARKSGADVAAQRDRTDRLIAAFRSGLPRIDLGGDPLPGQRLGDARRLLGQIDSERQAMDSADPAGVTRAQLYYNHVVAALLDVDGAIAAESSDRRTIHDATVLVLLSRLKELASQERGLIGAALSAGSLAQGQFEQLAAVIGMQDLVSAQFRTAASREQRQLYAARVGSANPPALVSLRRAVLSAGASGPLRADGLSGVGGVPGAREVLTDKVDRMRGVELRLGGEVATSSRARQAATRRSALVGSSLTVLVLVLAVAVALLMSESVARPLLRLRAVADHIARRQLPEMVERLQRGEITHLEAAAAPIEVSSGDEAGQAVRAVDAVHQVAVRLVAEQAALRLSVGEMFLNLARRSQDLVDRQLRLIDHLERDAEPEALEQLFKLDHLATRMRRSAESLIVLAGAEPPRRWSQPVPLGEIVRASVSEVQDYQRVELLPISDVGMSGHAVADVAHLLAELIENATSFSPPGTVVEITGHEVADGFVLEIEDRGLGMSDEELVEANERLSDPPAIEAGGSRMLGLYVVGRLARRHGIEAQLRHSWYGGVTAMVLLPHELTTWVGRREIAPPPPAPAPSLALPDELPIFEQTRSAWFDGEATAAPAPPAQAPAPAATPPPPRRRPDPGQVTGTGLPRRVPRANLAPGIVARQHQADGQPEDPPPTLPSRSPEEIRAMLSSYRSGLEHGRRTAAGLRETDGHTSQNGSAGSGPMAPRSDDDAAQ